MKDRVIIAVTTCPEDAADALAEALVAERLAACVNHLRGVASTYRWQGKVTSECESLLLIKTVEHRYDALAVRIRELHPYELPELVTLPVTGGSEAYLDWVRDETAIGLEA